MGSNQIKKAVAAVRDRRPAYRELLDFYENLFLAQEATKNDIKLKSINISKDLLLVKRKERSPLVNTKDFPIDVGPSEALLRKFCQFAGGSNEVLADAGTKIIDALERSTLDASILFSKVLGEDAPYWDELAGKLDIDKKILAFAAYSSIRPCLCLCAEKLATYLDREREWGKGYCPICGSPPFLSLLRGKGERSLCCSFCGHEWPTYRIYCPFCENRDQKRLHYFFSDEEKDCRVDVCEQCKKYIKTIDTREMKRPIHPFVEQISTLHLDMLAQEKGLESGIPLSFQT